MRPLLLSLLEHLIYAETENLLRLAIDFDFEMCSGRQKCARKKRDSEKERKGLN